MSVNRVNLFNLKKTVDETSALKPEKTKRKRKESTVKESKQDRKDNNTVINKQNDQDSGWKSFYDSRPEKLAPCEFYVDTGKKKEHFYAYVSESGLTCTDEPYKLIVLRKKYNNLYYREISGCNSVYNCPKMFPDCKNCRRKK
jgi:hypothetical protein